MTAVQKLIATIAALAVVGGGIYYFSARPQTPPSSGIATSTPNNTATTTNASTGYQLSTPDYKNPINFATSIPSNIRTQLNTQLVQVQANLAKNQLSVKDWIELGNIHKIGGDYQNAALYWEFVASSFSGTGVPYLSLGDLYENNLHDYVKAETNYKLAIETDPKNVNAYADLFTMYHYTLHDDTKAAAILAAGLKANPGNNYLLGLQSDLQSGK